MLLLHGSQPELPSLSTVASTCSHLLHLQLTPQQQHVLQAGVGGRAGADQTACTGADDRIMKPYEVASMR